MGFKGRFGKAKGAPYYDWWFVQFELTFINLERRKPPLYLPCSSVHLSFTKFQASSRPFCDPVTPPIANIVSWDRTSFCRENVEIEKYTIFISKNSKAYNHKFCCCIFQNGKPTIYWYLEDCSFFGGGGGNLLMVRKFQTLHVHLHKKQKKCYLRR